jgi:hypothetical protein
MQKNLTHFFKEKKNNPLLKKGDKKNRNGIRIGKIVLQRTR